MIHWCGTGLSAVPGLRALISAGHPVTVWNRTVSKAQDAVGDLTDDIRAFTPEDLRSALNSGDVVISMLPGDWHVPLAKMCIESGANFVSSSYISPEMDALDQSAREAGVALVNEVGLDPGIDHLMAHWLVADYKASAAYDPANELSFVSYCGGVPAHPNPFRYKFSWSALGVLKALKSPSRSIRQGAVWDVDRPWNAVSQFVAPLSEPEAFEVYPNRDSLPFMRDYHFDPDWTVKQFVRGTLRLDGWARAWTPVFEEIESLSGSTGDARLKEMSDTFWRENAYAEGEPDRVILCVGLKAERDGATSYDKTYLLDAYGDQTGSAMARLVSGTVSLAIQAILEGKLSPGVQAVPSSEALVEAWLSKIAPEASVFKIVDRA